MISSTGENHKRVSPFSESLTPFCQGFEAREHPSRRYRSRCLVRFRTVKTGLARGRADEYLLRDDRIPGTRSAFRRTRVLENGRLVVTRCASVRDVLRLEPVLRRGHTADVQEHLFWQDQIPQGCHQRRWETVCERGKLTPVLVLQS